MSGSSRSLANQELGYWSEWSLGLYFEWYHCSSAHRSKWKCLVSNLKMLKYLMHTYINIKVENVDYGLWLFSS